MKAHHTPGPWACFDKHLIHANGYRVATIESEAKHRDANTRLIAAAPELLAALEALLAELRSQGPQGDAVHLSMLSDVVAKAKGTP